MAPPRKLALKPRGDKRESKPASEPWPILIVDDDEQVHQMTRIILRDPARSDRDFVALAEQLGLHGVQYYVGYSAWLDIAPEGVTKAAGLDEVVRSLGVTAADVLAVGDGRNDAEFWHQTQAGARPSYTKANQIIFNRGKNAITLDGFQTLDLGSLPEGKVPAPGKKR